MTRSSACAVDDLLEELDGLLSSPVDSSKSASNSTAREPPSRLSGQTDDLDSLLAEMGASPTKPARPTREFPPPLAPTSAPPASSRSADRHGSSLGGESRYRCSKCDFKVLEFEDNVWDSTVDYMFFRNYVPNCEKLSTKLKPKEGKSALACQCAWASIESFVGKVPHDYWFKER
mmetsp:Transcript_47178/g.102455  ORF Transcript_47178/g.102455 Transcript_47178/m.102455 type:complete len:175 (-) Transcript_47178:440-964(-)